MSTERTETKKRAKKKTTRKKVSTVAKKETKKATKSTKKISEKELEKNLDTELGKEIEKVTKTIEKDLDVPQEQLEPKVSTSNLSENFLLENIKKNQESTQKIWKWGGLALLVLAIYLSAMVSSIKKVIFDTDGIATIVANEIDNNLPLQLKEIESSLIQTAPENSKELVSTIKTVLPKINSEAKQRINEVITIMPLFKEELTDAIKAYFVENEADMKSFVSSHSEQEFANYFMDDLLATVSLSLEEKLKSEGGLESVKSLSLNRLVELNSYLDYLAKKNRFDLTEHEQLQRRTIVTWVKLLENL